MKKGSRFFENVMEVKKAGQIKGRAGRNADLLRQRNDKLFHRYYYYGKILHKKYEVVLFALSSEFDLSESTITQLIEKSQKRIKEIRDKELTRGQLKKLYPLYNWNEKATDIKLEVKEREVYKGYDEKK